VPGAARSAVLVLFDCLARALVALARVTPLFSHEFFRRVADFFRRVPDFFRRVDDFFPGAERAEAELLAFFRPRFLPRPASRSCSAFFRVPSLYRPRGGGGMFLPARRSREIRIASA
jgi:hypothetical protein